MKNANRFFAGTMAISLSAMSMAAPSAPPSRIEIDFDPGHSPQSVDLQCQTDSSDVQFNPAASQTIFTAAINRSPSQKSVVNPCDLVVAWPDANETVYMNVGLLSPNSIKLHAYAPDKPSGFTLGDLSPINGLGSDLDSTLKKYLYARRFHHYWRFVIDEPNVEIAVRSARIWFDANTILVTRQPQVFRLDEDLKKIIDDYRTLATTDRTFRSILQTYLPNALVDAALQQMVAAPYKNVGAIPTLISQGRIYEAKTINDSALQSFNAASPEEQQTIVAKQHINRALLENNAAFIDMKYDGIEAAFVR